MDDDLKTMIEENNALIKESIDLAKKNAKKIKKVHSYMRRSFVAKITYWGIIILVAAGAFYAIKPRVQKLILKYENLQSQLEKTTNIVTNPTSVFDGIIPDREDLGILNKLFGE